MGDIMPVGSGPDQEIVAVLNNLFRGRNLATLRGHHTNKERLFGNNRRLERIAFRIGAYPTRDYSPDDAKRKWFYWLHHLPNGTKSAIKRILTDAMTNSAIRGVLFSVEENPITTHPHLFPSNSEQLNRYLNAARDKYLVHMVVREPMPDIGEDPPGDNDQDNNEVPIDWPKLRLRRPKFARPRRSK